MLACRLSRLIVIAAWSGAIWVGPVVGTSALEASLRVLSQDPSPPAPVRVRIAYAPGLRMRRSFRPDLDCFVKRASSTLEPALGRGLEVVDKVAWPGGKKDHSVRELVADLMRNVPRGDADIVVGLAGTTGSVYTIVERDNAAALPTIPATDRGLSAYRHGYTVISVGERGLCGAYRLLAHEIGHVFGGVHRDSSHWLMDPTARGVEIDPLNQELFALHRDRRFGPDIAPLDGPDLRTMWRLSGAELDDPRTWSVVGALAAKIGKPTAAARLYERAIEIDPGYLPAHVNLGHVRFMLGDYAEAEACYLRALTETPTDGMLHNNLAAIYYGRGELNRAAVHLVAAVSLRFEVDSRFISELERLTGQNLRQRH